MATQLKGCWFGLATGTVAHFSFSTNGHKPSSICSPRGFRRVKMADASEVLARPRCGKCERLLAFWERAGQVQPLSVA